MFKIGDFSRLCRITVRTLRYYDEIGLLKPVKVDTFTGYRYYSVDQLPRLNRIAMLKSLGLSLDEIRELLDNDLPANHISQLLQVKQSEIRQQLDEDEERLHQVEAWLDKINKGDIMPTDTAIQEKEVPELQVISRRETGAYQTTIPKLADELMEQINRPENQGRVTITGPVMMLCHEEEYKEEDADIEVVVPVSGAVAVENPSFEIKTLPQCRVLSFVHRGAYNSYYDIAYVYVQIYKYAEENNLELIPPDREVYLNNREEVPEDELLTEIQFPFKR